MSHLLRTLLFAALVSGTASSLAARIWVVDWLGNGDFLDLPIAVANAAPNDTLVVRGGFYDAPVIDKGLRILGLANASGALPLVRGELAIRRLPSGEELWLENLAFSRGACASSSAAARIEDCVGSVLFRGCSWTQPPACSTAVIEMRDASWVVFERCTIDAATRASAGPATEVLRLQRTRFEAYGCRFAASHASGCSGGDGAVALRCDAVSSLLLSDCVISGGDGGHADCVLCPNAVLGRGASAIRGGRVELHGGSLLGGTHGMYRCILPNPSGPRASTFDASQLVRTRSEALPATNATARLRPGGSTMIETRLGASGLAALFFALDLRPRRLPGIDGTLWLDLATLHLAGAAAGAAQSAAQIPVAVVADPWILGSLLALQVFDGVSALGEPLVIVVR